MISKNTLVTLIDELLEESEKVRKLKIKLLKTNNLDKWDNLLDDLNKTIIELNKKSKVLLKQSKKSNSWYKFNKDLYKAVKEHKKGNRKTFSYEEAFGKN